MAVDLPALSRWPCAR